MTTTHVRLFLLLFGTGALLSACRNSEAPPPPPPIVLVLPADRKSVV
jgi:hypothetical protein